MKRCSAAAISGLWASIFYSDEALNWYAFPGRSAMTDAVRTAPKEKPISPRTVHGPVLLILATLPSGS
jgi:hypothetical protein